MDINENMGGFITINQARVQIDAFRRLHPNEIKGGFIGINLLKHLLKAEDVMGMRIYNAYDEDSGVMNYCLVAVDKHGKDVTTLIADRLKPCPSTCDINSALY